MPVQYLPNKEEILASYEKAKAIDYRLATKNERISFIRYKKYVEEVFGLIEKKNPKKGLEDCLLYFKGDRAVCIFTSYVPEHGKMRTEDFIWALIIDIRYPEYPCFFTIPIKRTKHCLKRMIARAKALKNMVDNWQVCKEHTVDLQIVLVRGNKMHECSYVCPVGGYHNGIPRSIYTEMNEEDRKVLEKSFEAYQNYRDKEFEEGRDRIPQRALRAYGTNSAGYRKIKNLVPDIFNDLPYGENQHVDRVHVED